MSNDKIMDLKVGEVVQLVPGKTSNKMFGGCFMVVTELKSWGAQGYVQALGADRKMGGQAYYRALFEEMEKLTDNMAPFTIDLET